MNHPKQKRRLQMAARVQHLYSQVDRHLQTVPERERFTCRRGCAACCRMMIVVTYPEAVALVARYPKEVARALPALRADLEATIAIAKAEGVEPGAPAEMLSGETNARMCEAWWLLQRTCPFLSAENECTVYEARPLACRTYHVVTPAALCARVPVAPGVGHVRLNSDDELMVVKALGAVQIEAGMGPFTCAPFAEMVLHAQHDARS